MLHHQDTAQMLKLNPARQTSTRAFMQRTDDYINEQRGPLGPALIPASPNDDLRELVH